MCLFRKSTLAALASCALAFAQPATPSKRNLFPYSTQGCPDFAQIARSRWIPEALQDYKRRLVRCEPTTRTLALDAAHTLTLVQYQYHFRENSDYLSSQQFSFLVEDSTRAVLWEHWAEFPSGALEDIRLVAVDQHPILELELSTGGTAGNWEEYYLYADGALSPVGMAFKESAKTLIPEEYSIRRIRVDLDALTAIVYLSTRTDPNCCPSAQLDLKLAYRANNLVLRSGGFSKNQPTIPR